MVDNIKMDLEDGECNCVDCINWLRIVSSADSCEVSFIKGREFLELSERLLYAPWSMFMISILSVQISIMCYRQSRENYRAVPV
jgi:hypothetical protein